MPAQQPATGTEKRIDPPKLADSALQQLRISIKAIHQFLFGEISSDQIRSKKSQHQYGSDIEAGSPKHTLNHAAMISRPDSLLSTPDKASRCRIRGIQAGGFRDVIGI